MEPFPIFLVFTLLLFFLFAILELCYPQSVQEGFESLAPPKPTFWASFSSPRYDIGSHKEDPSFIRDPRYFNDYVDVSRMSAQYDFCRMIAPLDDPTNYFFACALAGTENLPSTTYRTDSVSQGFRISIDDYMRDINGDGREDYCRILKLKDGSYQPVCARAQDFTFDSREIVDPAPPQEILTLVSFYQGCVLWYRFFGDIHDTMKQSQAHLAGKVYIDETPRRNVTEGIALNGKNQYIRIGDSPDLSLGMRVPIRSIRTWMIWAKFDVFTNNAKLFDFGNGKAMDNVFLGILEKGDPSSSQESLQQGSCESGQESTVPKGPSGAQPAIEMSPQRYMETSDGNVNEFVCSGFDVQIPEPASKAKEDSGPVQRASLVYEIWDKQARKFRMKLNQAVPLKTWTHICITTTSSDAFRPTLSIYVNGVKALTKEDGFLPATGSMSNCYVGRSNWADSVSQYQNRDELFQGNLFDFRAYSVSVSEDFIDDSYQWGRQKLNLK